MRKGLVAALALALLLSLAGPAAASASGEEALTALETLGLLTGTENGLEPDRSPTRAEALVMTLRLLGVERAAAESGCACPFTDGGWAANYIGYAYQNGLAYGISDTEFGSGRTVSARDYLTLVLRVLGYSDVRGDFSWAESIAFADSIGLTHGEFTADGEFVREDMALVSYTALTLPCVGGDTLAEVLYRKGALSAASLKATRLANVVRSDDPHFNAAQVHEMCASAVVLVEAYSSAEALEKDKADSHGSGFFLTEDGVIAMTYHELDGYSYARVTTLDGHRFNVTGVLWYDVMRDLAVVRVGRTDLEGNSVRRFPYLDLGDPDALSAGDPVFSISNALGYVDSISSGIVANRSRLVDDPEYPCLQVTAPLSPGSSGGPLLSDSGEVVGILYGSFINGQNMNLVIPANCLAAVELTGEGTPLEQVCAAEDEKKMSATITAERKRVTLHVGEEQKMLISNDCPGQANMHFGISDPSVVSCVWGHFVTKQSAELSLIGLSAGICEVTITFVSGDGNNEASAVIKVTVLDD